MSCWTVLGLPASADTRTIKRQYATLLKQTRPDEDPEGFQRLREAYERALAQKQFEQMQEENQADDEGWGPPDLAVAETAPTQLVQRPLESASLHDLEKRYAHALQTNAVDALEVAVLRHCIAQPDGNEVLLEWAFDTFHWLSAWQRLELDEGLIEQLLSKQRQRIKQLLSEPLDREDAEGFLQAYARCSRHRWFKGEEHRQWVNTLISHLLLDSPYWSADIFDAVCVGQGWHSGSDNACPDTEWTRLLARRDAKVFLARQRELAVQPAITPQHRAARLLLAQGPFVQRRIVARRLREDDWAQCYELSSMLYAFHPQIREAMPGGTPFFWRDWENTFDSWPIYLGIALACLMGTVAQYMPGGVRLGALFSTAMFWSVVFAVAGAVLHEITHRLANELWGVEDRLRARLPRGFIAPLFGLLPDLLACALIATGLGKVYGPVASASYVGTLIGVGVLRRFPISTQVSWERSSPVLKRCLMGAGVLLLIALLGVFNLKSRESTVNRNQGLQPWAERLCSRMPASASDCSAPATHEQWYGREAHL